MKYTVIGLGAVGSIVGGLLTNSGENVVLGGGRGKLLSTSLTFNHTHHLYNPN